MDLFSTPVTDLKSLFTNPFNPHNEQEVEDLIKANPKYFIQTNWKPLGQNENNYGVIENQQASPIAALVEKLTNSIDATLMRKCYEAGIDPKSADAPQSLEAAVRLFYKDQWNNWDLKNARKAPAENIQIVASGQKLQSGVFIAFQAEGREFGPRFPLIDEQPFSFVARWLFCFRFIRRLKRGKATANSTFLRKIKTT